MAFTMSRFGQRANWLFIMGWVVFYMSIGVSFFVRTDTPVGLTAAVVWLLAFIVCIVSAKGLWIRASVLAFSTIFLAHRLIGVLVLATSCIVGKECM